MTLLVLDLLKSRSKPYGHTSYTRHTKSGKLAYVKEKGVPSYPAKVARYLHKIGGLPSHPVSSVKIEGTGFTLNVERAANPVEATEAIMKAVSGLQKVFKLDGENHKCTIAVRDIYDTANARYFPGPNEIVIDSKNGKESFYHEFGHFVDFKVLTGEPESRDSHVEFVWNTLDRYDKNIAERNKLVRRVKNLESLPTTDASVIEHLDELIDRADEAIEEEEQYLSRYQPVTEWCRAVQKSGVLKRLTKKNSKHVDSKHLKYLQRPREIFARFFNDWCFERLKEKHAKDTSATVGSDHAIRFSGYDRQLHPDGALMSANDFTKEEFDFIRPSFEKMMTKKLLKALEAFLLKAHVDQLKGGKADNKKPSDFDPQALREGMKVEREHTDDPAIAREIAMDHLTEDPQYYVKLRKIHKEKAFVIHVGDLRKARTVGAVADTISGGKYGRIVKLRDQTVWRLEAKHAARIGEILKYYQDNGIPFLYIEPGNKISRAEMEKRADATGRAEASETPKKVAAPEVPATMVESAYSKPQLEALDALYARVADWTRPDKYEHVTDPRYRVELEKLTAARRSIGVERRRLMGVLADVMENKPRGYKTEVKELRKELKDNSATFNEAGRRIRQILGTARPTKGGGLQRITKEDAVVIGTLPHSDLGFSPLEKPMSYLISLGWQKKDSKGGNRFSKKEFAALSYEYERFMNRIVGRLVGKFAPSLGVENGSVYAESGGWSQKKRRGKFKEWKDEATTILYDLAQSYGKDGAVHDSEKHELSKKYYDTGTPSQTNNFALYVHTVLPLRLTHAIRDNDSSARTVLTEDIDSMPERGGHTLTPVTRVETPEQAFQRRDLEGRAAGIFSDLLTPLQAAIVAARLNFDANVGGTYRRVQGPETDRGERVGWSSVRQRVVEGLHDFMFDAKAREAAAEKIAGMKDSALEKLYLTALEKIRGVAGDLTSPERQVLSDLVKLKTAYLQGIRHEVWDQNETFGKLIVHREKDERSARAEAGRSSYVVSPLISQRKVLRFWQKNPALAAVVRIDTNYTSMPNVQRSKKAEVDDLKANVYFKALEKLRAQSADEIQSAIVSQASAAPVGYHGRVVKIPQYDYQQLLEYALAEKQRGSVTKSFVILNLETALDELIAESRLWSLNGA